MISSRQDNFACILSTKWTRKNRIHMLPTISVQFVEVSGDYGLMFRTATHLLVKAFCVLVLKSAKDLCASNSGVKQRIWMPFAVVLSKHFVPIFPECRRPFRR